MCSLHDRVIVIEDDLDTSVGFLAYLNSALARYEQHERVMQVSGHCFPARGFETSEGCSFLPFTTTLGWGTWARAWRHFDWDMTGIEEVYTNSELRRRFEIDGAYPYLRLLKRLQSSRESYRSWGLRWHWSVLKRDGVVLYPHRTLVSHFGSDDTGTNVRGVQLPVDVLFERRNQIREWPKVVAVDMRFYAAVRRYLAAQQSLWSRGHRFLRRVLLRPWQ